MNKNNIKIFDSLDTLAQGFIDLFIDQIDEKPNVSIALSGGNTPNFLFEKLAKSDGLIEWKNVSLYWSDERCVSPNDPESNYYAAKNLLIDQVNIPIENVHRIMGENYPVLESIRYGCELLTTLHSSKKIPFIDILLLGLGEDGHTASIFPGNHQLVFSENLFEVAQYPLTGQTRITVTGKVIEKARKVIFLVTGKNKAKTLGEILNQKGNFANYPAWHVNNLRNDIQWWLDKEAASEISN